MKNSLTAVTALLLILLTSSCKKDKDQVHIRFENKSQDVLKNVRLTYYSGVDQQSQNNIELRTLSPNQSSDYISFESMTCFEGIAPFVVLEATNNGKQVKSVIRCATTRPSNLAYGYYTAHIHASDGGEFLFLQLDQ
jgi:hypothetical protein